MEIIPLCIVLPSAYTNILCNLGLKLNISSRKISAHNENPNDSAQRYEVFRQFVYCSLCIFLRN